MMLSHFKQELLQILTKNVKPSRKWRPPWLPTNIALKNEANVHPHVPSEKAELFLSFNAGTTEMEVLNWLYATIILLKPENIIETGAADGLGTIALASACKANGFGKVHSVELDYQICSTAEQRIIKADLKDYVQYHCSDSFAFLQKTNITFQFGFFDSLCEIRAEECEICHTRNILKGPSVFHDTSEVRSISFPDWPKKEQQDAYRKKLIQLAQKYYEGQIFESCLSRGLTVLWPKKWPL